MRHQHHAEALRVASAVALEFGLVVKDAAMTTVRFPSYAGHKPQRALRITLQSPRGGLLVSVTVRKHEKDRNPLCDIAVSHRKGDHVWTQLPREDGTFPEKIVCSQIADYL